MYYVYILKSKKNNELYTGCTNDLKKRLIEHNSGRVFSTKSHIPYILVHYEYFLNRKDAYLREKWLKTGWGKNHVKTMLKNYLEEMNPPKLSNKIILKD